MHTAWEYNSSRSTLTVIKTTHRGIWNYPFPAVTVCNLNRISAKKAKQFRNIPKNITRNGVVQQLRYLLALFDPGVFDNLDNIHHLQNLLDNNNVTVVDVMRQISPDCSRLLIGCKWKGNQVNCGKIIKQSLSRDGFCCSFNYTSPFDSSVIQKQNFEKVTSCGYQTGLTIAINPEPDDYLAPLLGSYGVKILLHFPYNYPDYNAVSKLIGMGYQVFLSISPTEIYSTPAVRKLSISNRKCLFHDENINMPVNSSNIGMEFYHYSYINCMTACRAEAIISKCGCLPFYYEQKSTRICNLTDVKCLKENRDFFDTSFPGYDSKIKVTNELIQNTDRPCNCLPDCTLYQYDIEDSQGTLKMTKSYADDPFLKDLNITSQSTVHIFFADLVSLQYCRNVYFDWHNLFASFGGLLGLFAGFSLMSGCELIYFFIIRITSDSCIRNKNKQYY
ncbi:sodium channel protein Nach-like [Aphidius gifuensis]|uniref:sodium channel protein Nach-like n=1 Tax=Aphidius gifuensis TaxID=684658 RepID=UPI001CDD829E|nr:sodium channel protein Nach-like [Aphidius gifuensis]